MTSSPGWRRSPPVPDRASSPVVRRATSVDSATNCSPRSTSSVRPSDRTGRRRCRLSCRPARPCRRSALAAERGAPDAPSDQEGASRPVDRIEPAPAEDGDRAASGPPTPPSSPPPLDADEPSNVRRGDDQGDDVTGHSVEPIVVGVVEQVVRWVEGDAAGSPLAPQATVAVRPKQRGASGATSERASPQPRVGRRTARRVGVAERGNEPASSAENPAPITVTIGRIELRTVEAPPPQPRRAPSLPTPPAAAPLRFSGPTLDEFLGGR